MKSFLTDSVFLGVVVSLLTYEFGLWFKKKVKIAIFNPLLISVIAVMVFLVVFHIDYADYQEGAKYISYLLTPATVCLAVPLYEQFELLRKNLKAVRNHFRGIYQHDMYSGSGFAFSFRSSAVCYITSKIYHNSDRNGSF